MFVQFSYKDLRGQATLCRNQGLVGVYSPHVSDQLEPPLPPQWQTTGTPVACMHHRSRVFQPSWSHLAMVLATTGSTFWEIFAVRSLDVLNIHRTGIQRSLRVFFS